MKTELLLDAEGIDRVVEEVGAFLSDTGLSKREALAGRLSFENVLIMWHEHFGEGVPATIQVGNRFGKPSIVVSVRGDRFDPRVADRSVGHYEPIARTMMQESGFIPTYAYRGGSNIITFTRPRKPLSSLTQILVAFLLGLLVSLLGKSLLSESNTTYLLEKLVNPLFDLYLAMLSGLAGPLIFFTVAWGVCGVGDVAALGRSGKSLVGRFLRDNCLAAIFACMVCIPFFSLPLQVPKDGGDFVGEVVKMVLDLLPTNIVTAFGEGNTSEIIIIGLLVGVATLVLGDKCDKVRRAIEELNSLSQFLMEQLCRFIPAFIFVMVLSQVWSGTFVSLATTWIPLLLVVVLVAIFFALKVAYICMRHHIPVKKLLSALKPAMMLGLTTASSCAALGSMISGCIDDLGVGKEQTSFGIPLGMILGQQPTIIMLVALSMHCMKMYGLGADIVWYITMALLCFLYSMVAPPVPGGLLVCIGLLFGKLGIPAEAIGMATAFNIVIDYVLTCYIVGTAMTGVFETACALGSVDRSKLESVNHGE